MKRFSWFGEGVGCSFPTCYSLYAQTLSPHAARRTPHGLGRLIRITSVICIPPPRKRTNTPSSSDSAGCCAYTTRTRSSQRPGSGGHRPSGSASGAPRPRAQSFWPRLSSVVPFPPMHAGRRRAHRHRRSRVPQCKLRAVLHTLPSPSRTAGRQRRVSINVLGSVISRGAGPRITPDRGIPDDGVKPNTQDLGHLSESLRIRYEVK